MIPFNLAWCGCTMVKKSVGDGKPTKGIRFDGLMIVVFPPTPLLLRVWNSWPLALWQGHKWVRGSHGQAGF